MRPKTPDIDEKLLASFDANRQKISNLIVSKDAKVELT